MSKPVRRKIMYSPSLRQIPRLSQSADPSLQNSLQTQESSTSTDDQTLPVVATQDHADLILEQRPPSPAPTQPALSDLLKKAKPAERTPREKWHLVALVVLLFLPSFLIPYELANIFVMYRQVQDGTSHLQAAAAVFQSNTGSTGDGFSRYFDPGKLHQTLQEIDAAHVDFASLSARLEQDGALSLTSPFWPTQINTIRALGSIAADGTAVAARLLTTMSDIGPSIIQAIQSTPSSTDNTSPTAVITPASYQEINNTLDAIAPLVHRMTQSAQGLSINSLPINGKQQKLLASILPLLPTLDAVLMQRDTLREPLEWMLGIGQQRTFLVEPMDSSELRATGGFTGQFGELAINGAHIGSLKLSNIGIYEEDHSDVGSPPDPTVYPKVRGQTPPLPYSVWWPIPNFGMRDANLSADFPTSARLVMNRYTYEFGRNVDGVIMFTPTLIEQVLDVTGPIAIPAYNQTITAQNLTDLLHYYQLDNTGIYQEEVVEHVNDTQVARKLFTQRVTTALINTVTHLPLDKMLSLADQVFQSMKTKDLQVYVTNPAMESLIGTYGSTGALDRSANQDELTIVQSNLGANKASQYVMTTIQDTIQLDQQGGATHNLHLTLDYQPTGDVYGLPTYRDYVRIYVPLTSQLITGNGFDQYDMPYCGDGGSGYQLCQSDVYGNGALICASPFQIGFAPSFNSDPYENTDHPLDMIGPPQNQESDEVGYAMFGGWVVIPQGCSLNVTLSWHVPPTSGQPYHLLFQAQASVYSPLYLTIQPPAGTCAPEQGNSLHFAQTMNGENRSFTVKQQGSQCSLAAS